MHTANVGQPVVTALQLALVDLLASWNIRPLSVVGHSSGEIAAAYAAGMLSYESAMAVAYWRGEHASRAYSDCFEKSGSMMAVPLSESDATRQISYDPAWKGKIVVACCNSPCSVTLSGDSPAMVELQKHLESQDISARLLKVDTAYHSHHMQKVSANYLSSISKILPLPSKSSNQPSFFSSVSATQIFPDDLQPSYWIQNLTSQVRFCEALQEMCRTCKSADPEAKGLDMLIELGPHATLATPIKQTLQTGDLVDFEIDYVPSLKRKEDAVFSIHRLASQLWSSGAQPQLEALESSDQKAPPKLLTDLPIYQWDRSLEHWNEPRISREYRNRPHPRHELLGTRSIDFDPIFPKWRNNVRLAEVPWLRDHMIESQIIYPAAGFLAMVIEAARQTVIDCCGSETAIMSIKFQKVTIERALMLHDDSDGVEVVTTLQPLQGKMETTSLAQYDFRIRSFDQQEDWTDHCQGSITLSFGVGQQRETQGTVREVCPGNTSNHLRMIEKEAIYDDFRQQNIQYRGSFSNITQLSASFDSAVAAVERPSFVGNQPNGMDPPALLHPTVVDGCFQVLLALMLRSKRTGRPPLLNFIQELNIPNFGLVSANEQLQLRAKIFSAGSLATNGYFEAWTDEKDIGHCPLISGSGIHIIATSGPEHDATAQKPTVYKLDLIPDVDLLEPSRVRDLCHFEVAEPEKSAEEELEAFEALSLYFVQRALHAIESPSHLAENVQHLRHLWNWMQTHVRRDVTSEHPDYMSWDEGEIMRLIHRVQGFGDEGKMLVRMGYSLPAILDGTAQPLPLMLEGDLLSTFYQNDSLCRCYVQMGKYLHLLGLKNPAMAIIEIGAGTGGTTVPVLEALSGARAGNSFMFESYDFTDISSGFFDKAQSLLERWKGFVNYKRLNIEKRPSTQGFKPGSYDLVIASNVLHATCDIKNTIANVRELLKPGGKFVLLEITKLQAHLNVSFGGLPGWWAGTCSR